MSSQLEKPAEALKHPSIAPNLPFPVEVVLEHIE